ncbi:MAG: TauD/TfdA family dioxygenase, partial [Cocleimonas sp.]
MSYQLNNVELLAPEVCALKTVWDDGKQSKFHYIWLRDNCPSNFHPDTHERVFDLLSISDDIHPTKVEFDNESLTIDWSEGSEENMHQSIFPLEWLYQNAYSGDLKKDKRTNYESWAGDFADRIPRVEYAEIMNHDSALLTWMKQLDMFGITIVKNTPKTEEAVSEIAKRISFLRQTNFGVTFDVVSTPKPINLAYTSMALPLHTDLPNQEVPPGIQFLHCLENESEGGESIYVDSLRVLEDMRKEEPEKFQLLADTAIPFRFHDTECDLRHHHSMINLDSFGNIVEIKYNAHLADIFDISEDIMHGFYLAYRDLMRRFKGPEYKIKLKLEGGDMAVFDNRRVMHGRAEFKPNTGRRHLRGCYV